jgi:DNA-binding NarL/FixJ family response regulator
MSICGPILVVDDVAAFRDYVGEILEQAGFATIKVSTGEQALAAAGSERPALVLLDVHLVGLSGYEVCRHLRERFGERLPIVFVSGERTEPHDRVAGLLLGADDYLTKPFFGDELVVRMRRLLLRASEDERAAEGPANRLTPREREVLQLLAQGRAQDAITAELHISSKTVATHIQRILTKLQVHSRAEAVAQAYRIGLVRADTEARHLG